MNAGGDKEQKPSIYVLYIALNLVQSWPVPEPQMTVVALKMNPLFNCSHSFKKVYTGYYDMVNIIAGTWTTKMQEDSSCPQGADKIGEDEIPQEPSPSSRRRTSALGQQGAWQEAWA